MRLGFSTILGFNNEKEFWI